MATPNQYKDRLIEAINEYEGYALRVSYGRDEMFLRKCDAIRKVASRAKILIENSTNSIPRTAKYFFLESMHGNVPRWTKIPHEVEFWAQVNKELGL